MLRVLDDGLDELAARSHDGLALRIPVTLGIAALCSLMLPWRVCLAWCAVQCLSEGISWFVSRPQAQGRKAGTALRLAHLGTVAAGCTIWMALGGLLWTSGTPAGAISGAVLWLSVIFFAQNNAYQSPTGFVVSGALPALGMLLLVTFGPNRLGLPLLPVVGVIVVALCFACDGVLRALATRRRFEATETRLRESEARAHIMANSVSDVLMLNRLSGERVYVSPSVRQVVGYEPEDLFSSNFELLHPEDLNWAPEAIARVIRTGEPATLQYRVMHKDGHAVWVETTFTLVRDHEPDAEPLLMSVCRNIDARKALETELVEARQRAEQAAAAKSDFLANMTHELRTPLNAIIGFSSVLKDSPRLADEDARHVRLIHEASGDLLELVNTVLDFSKLEAGAVELETAPFDPAGPARAVAALLAEQASAKDLDLSVKTEGEIRPLMGDATRIRQVLLNFLSNALKFTAVGGVTVTVRQHTIDEGRDRLRIEVADTGIGVAANHVKQLFDRFTQADASVSRKYGGTGLGLAICKRTVELMGGEIGCVSVRGEGSTFWLEVVLEHAEALLDEAEALAEEAPERPLHVLLVEDVAVNRELIMTLLAPFDVEIQTAENGKLAVEAFRAGAFDLVLMDVQMPVMDGLTATRTIRALKLPHAQTTPIIAMTANVLPDQVRTCLAAGMDDHLGKPISPAALLQALSRWSEGREAGAEAERETA